jgi:hypothetical protein
MSMVLGTRAPAAGGSPFGARFATQLAGASGRPLRLEGLWRPVIGLGEAAFRGHVLHLDVRESLSAVDSRPVDFAALNPVDLERIDLAAAEHGFAALPEAEASEHPPLAFLGVSWSTARTPRARRRLLQIAAKSQVRLKTLPVCEIHGLEPGAPASVVRETAGLLQPIFRGVLVRISPKRLRSLGLADCGLTGAAVEAGDLAESRDQAAMLRTVLSLQRVGPGVMLHSLRSVAALSAARAAGARWASLDIVRSGWHVAHAAVEALSEERQAAL